MNDIGVILTVGESNNKTNLGGIVAVISEGGICEYHKLELLEIE